MPILRHCVSTIAFSRACVNLAAPPQPQHSAGAVLPALVACGRRGRWKTALGLLAQLEAADGETPLPAYHSALLACRKKERTEEASDVLRRMGDMADTSAYNEVLHLLRLKNDFEGAQGMWATMPKQLRDSLSYYHILHLCGDQGRWKLAISLLEEMSAHLGEGGGFHAGHYLAAIRACARDRRWAESVALAKTIPSSILESDTWLCRAVLGAASETGETELASRLLEALGAKAKAEDHSHVLVACRRKRCVESARAAWTALEASKHGPDEVCYAIMIGVLFDAVQAMEEVEAAEEAEAAAAAVGSSRSLLVQEAMAISARAATELPAGASPVALQAAVGGAIGASGDRGTLASAVVEAMELLSVAEGNAARAEVQIKVLQVCTDAGDWATVEAEARRAVGRGVRIVPTGGWLPVDAPHGGWQPPGAPAAVDAAPAAADDGGPGVESGGGMADSQHHLLDAIDKFIRHAREASEASGGEAAAGAAEALCALAEAVRKPPVEGEVLDEKTTEAQQVARRKSQSRYSRSIALPAVSAPLEVLYEDEDLLAVSKPIGISVHPRHRFESNSMVNRAVAHLGGRQPYVLHRLDSPTSGVLLLAKTVIAARSVHRQFARREAEKTYLAVLLGSPAADAFEIDALIAEHPTEKTLSVVVPKSLAVPKAVPRAPSLLRGGTSGSEGGLEEEVVARAVDDDEGDLYGGGVASKGEEAVAAALRREEYITRGKGEGAKSARKAFTRFEVVARGSLGAACRVRPLTGRMHQIRVHAEHAGHPLAGDTQYGVALQPKEPKCTRLLLHAHSLRVQHPTRPDSFIRFTAPPPDSFAETAELLGVGETVRELQSGGGAEWE